MSLNAASESLQQALKLLMHQWRATSAQWKDAVGRRFEKNYMDEYEPIARATLKQLGELEQAIDLARRNVP